VGKRAGPELDPPLQPSEHGSLGPGESGTPEAPVHLVSFATPGAISFDALEDCSGAIFETPVAGSEGAPTLSCYFSFCAPTLGSWSPPAPWVTGPYVAERGPDPAPELGFLNTPGEPARAPPAPDPGGWVGAEVEVAGGSGSPDARPASEDPESSGDHPEEVNVSVEDAGVRLSPACSEEGGDPVSPTEGPLVPTWELRALLLDRWGHRDSVQLALGRWPGAALLVRSARALSREVPERDEDLRRRTEGFLVGLEGELAGAPCADAPPSLT